MKALHRHTVQGIFKATGTFDDSILTFHAGVCI